jgi:hypothetical protein
MGATGSRPSPTDTHLVRISDYSKIVRLPLLQERTLTRISSRGILWNVTVEPRQFNEGLAEQFNEGPAEQFNEGLADCILVSVFLDPLLRYIPDLNLNGIHISLEILDETGENIVFMEESNVRLQAKRCLIMGLCRRELEASSCVHNDSFTVRCTLSKQQVTKRCIFSKPRKLAVLEPQVAMAGSHMITIGSFSKLKAALRNGECTYSTHFAVAGCIWYFKFSPAGIFGLARASTHRTSTTAEFSFELEGAVNFQSDKMTHTFHVGYNSRYLYRFRVEPSTSVMNDRLIVRCHLAVAMVEKPSLPHVASSRIVMTLQTESILTPLLSAMYEGDPTD